MTDPLEELKKTFVMSIARIEPDGTHKLKCSICGEMKEVQKTDKGTLPILKQVWQCPKGCKR